MILVSLSKIYSAHLFGDHQQTFLKAYVVKVLGDISIITQALKHLGKMLAKVALFFSNKQKPFKNSLKLL